jgi:hypothetical protein
VAKELLELYIRRRNTGDAPRKILLDFDSTDDPTHGEQVGTCYHGYYEQHMYRPLLVFNGERGQLATVVLGAGNTHSSCGAVAILKRIGARLREAWPSVEIELRADAGFPVPALYDYCEAEVIDFTIGLITNACLRKLASSLLEGAKERLGLGIQIKKPLRLRDTLDGASGI